MPSLHYIVKVIYLVELVIDLNQVTRLSGFKFLNLN